MCWRCATIHQTAPRIEQVAEIWCLSFTLLTRIIFCRPTFISVWWKALLKCSFTGITCTLCTCCCRAKSSAQTESAPLVVQSVLKCVDRFSLDHLLWQLFQWLVDLWLKKFRRNSRRLLVVSIYSCVPWCCGSFWFVVWRSRSAQPFLFLSESCRFQSSLLVVAFFAGALSSLTCVIFLHTMTSCILLLIWSLSSGPSLNGWRLLSSIVTKLVWHILSVVLHILCKWLRILPCLSPWTVCLPFQILYSPWMPL